jgi:hypothetical protein
MAEYGFQPIETSHYWGYSATWFREPLLIRIGYYEHDEWVDVEFAIRVEPDLSEQPYWSYVRLREILERRAPKVCWQQQVHKRNEADAALAEGARLMRMHAADLLEGRDFSVLAETIRSRPQRGVPGFDYPVDAPFAVFSDGHLVSTDSETSKHASDYLEQSFSEDVVVRARAALKLPGATPDDDIAVLEACHMRLHELLSNAEWIVRAAASDSLAEWSDADAFEEILELLDSEQANHPSPIARAVAVIARNEQDRAGRDRARASLRAHAAKGPVAKAQVERLLTISNVQYGTDSWQPLNVADGRLES